MILKVCWRSSKAKKWFFIGELSYENNRYKFVYDENIYEAQEQGFELFTNLSDVKLNYYSYELFPVFANRLLSKSRSEYKKYQEWLDLKDDKNPLEELSKNNGFRVVDFIALYLIPKVQKKYVVEFFLHNVDCIFEYQKCLNQIKQGDNLYLAKDIQNKFDKNAILVRTKDPMSILGYIPRIYNEDIASILAYDENATLSIKKINKDAPVQFQILCRFEAKWPKNFIAFDTRKDKNES
ncbi:HIRAN domain-containing protein [Campylobacter coli]|nr:HIRAN domain-containing protein [Campylobacter jejuni]HEB9322059.1 HIRAN domain-containing protein [Campylobacter coli]HEB9348940.1 HIRAN domain-containing protein [Campylobacter coli]HEB9350689.1 HIRAN domain-containing protein [Campylobacter coli]HEB9428692.1 HIRAN domain-containing protein [Campylobacter coli]